jgi:hypothetical protein
MCEETSDDRWRGIIRSLSLRVVVDVGSYRYRVLSLLLCRDEEVLVGSSVR